MASNPGIDVCSGLAPLQGHRYEIRSDGKKYRVVHHHSEAFRGGIHTNVLRGATYAQCEQYIQDHSF